MALVLRLAISSAFTKVEQDIHLNQGRFIYIFKKLIKIILLFSCQSHHSHFVQMERWFNKKINGDYFSTVLSFKGFDCVQFYRISQELSVVLCKFSSFSIFSWNNIAKIDSFLYATYAIYWNKLLIIIKMVYEIHIFSIYLDIRYPIFFTVLKIFFNLFSDSKNSKLTDIFYLVNSIRNHKKDSQLCSNHIVI